MALLVSCKTSSSEEINESQSTEILTDSVGVQQEEIEDLALNKAPNFKLPSVDGREYSLSDFEGKLVYLDIWATWCGPCKIQFPALKELHEKYKSTGIEIVSVSIDPEQFKSKWEQMIKEKKLTGVQLFAGQETSFAQDYKVDFIPRFVLISPNGDLLMENAPTPLDFNSGGINPELVKIFDLYLQANK